MAGGLVISHVLDTCALLDLAAGRWTSSAARAALETADAPAVLCVSVWEIARKRRLGKLTLPCDQRGVLDFVEAVCERHALELIPLTAAICHEAELLPPHHEDPFDRMILALALSTRAPIFTTDPKFAAYAAQVIAHR
jgi:PIN domain nuclease of toxin-antitoxin system